MMFCDNLWTVLTIDTTNDITVLPELNFEDFYVDTSPTKSPIITEDPLEIENEPKSTETSTIELSSPGGNINANKNRETVAVTVVGKIGGDKLLPSTSSNTITSSMVSPIVLNSKNILPKTTIQTPKQILKVSPSLTTKATLGNMEGKTTIKTNNGQIIYLQKASDGVKKPVAGNKTLVFRTVDGTLLPVKTTSSPKPVLTTTFPNKKLVPHPGGKMIIKSTAAVTTATTTTTSTTTSPLISTPSGKIVVQGANGKKILVTNQSIIKLSAKLPNQTTGINKPTIETTNSAGQVHAIHIPGKSGFQYVRVMPSTKIAPTSTVTSVQQSSVVSSVANSTVKVLNTIPQKFHVVRPSTSKLVVTPSPKENESSAKLSTPTTPMQKTVVTVPTLRSINDNKELIPSAKSPNVTPELSNIIKKKIKISELNSEIHRITSGFTPKKEDGTNALSKKPNANRIVVVSRSMLRTKLPTVPPRTGVVQRLPVQNVANGSVVKPPSAQIYTPAKQILSILKNNKFNPQTSAEMKSLIICGQAQVLMTQQQQNKSMQIKKQIQNQGISSQTNLLPVKIKVESTDEKDVVPVTENTGCGGVRRKHCNCSKSQCLKLYCDCFANGEFCQDCTCKDCFNNLNYEDERQRAIRSCLERNPSAFKPKITTARDQGDMRLHNKGCNCKRSGCLKNYCECYEAKIPCSSNCKCVGCRNIEDRPDLDMDPIDSKISTTGALMFGQKRTYSKSNLKENDKIDCKQLSIKSEFVRGDSNNSGVPPTRKQQCNFITQEVIDATIQCMISQADECEKKGLYFTQTERMVMEELGRCLVEIIDFSIRNTDGNYSQE